jgi:isocitrate lyase
MAKFLVQVMLDYEAALIVEADDVYQANAMAEAKAQKIYNVWNEDSEENESFHSITAYDPVEMK